MAMFLGGCFNEFDTNAISISLWTNTTTVVDYNSDPAIWNVQGIPPYERPYSLRDTVCLGPVACYGDDCAVSSGGGPGIGSPSCDLPNTCSFLGCTGSDATVNQSVYHNCYHKTTQSINLSRCEHIGFRNLVFRKVWQGRKSYNCRDTDTFNGYGNWDAFDYCGNNFGYGYHAYDPSPDPYKYRTVNASATTTLTGIDPTTGGWIIVGTASGMCSCDRYSGATTSTVVSSAGVTSGTGPPGFNPLPVANYTLGILNVANSFGAIILEAYSNAYQIQNSTGLNPPTTITQHSANSWTLTWDYGDTGTGTLVSASLFIDMASFSYSYGYNATGPSTMMEEYDTINCSATTLNRTHFFKQGCPLESNENGITDVISCTLSDAYTSDMVMADWLDLAENYWNIGNDINYSWRYRSYENNTNAPIIQRDEVIGIVAINGNGPDASLYNGSVIGGPNSIVSGSAPFWDGKFMNWEDVTPMGGDCIGIEQRGYGGWSGNGGIPLAATHWSDLLQTKQIPQGAFLFYGEPELIGGIDAQVYLTYQSYKQSRPCGPLDRFMLQTTASNCISSNSSSISGVISNSMVFIDPLSFPNHIVGAMTASVWGTGNTAIDGIWVVDGTSDGTCSLISLVKSGSDLPFGEVGMWGYASDTTYGNGQICAMRWISDVPAFCGTTPIENVIKNTPLTVSLSNPQMGIINGDKIKIAGCSGSTELNGNIYTFITMGSPYTNFALLGTTSASISTPYTGSGYAYIQPSSSWAFNNVTSKGNYVIGTLDSTQIRNTGEYWRLTSSFIAQIGCIECDGVTTCPEFSTISLPPTDVASFTQSFILSNPCSAPTIAILPTPSSHSFINAKIHPFKMNMVLDNRYGNAWQSWIIQSMPDPLYAGMPPCPCRENLPCDSIDPPLGFDCFGGQWTWQEDGGLCQGIQNPFCDGMGGVLLFGADYFAEHDIYEAILSSSLPLPAGLNYTQSYVTPSINGLTYNTWYLFLSEYNCTCANGRFSNYYNRNGVGCNDPTLLNTE